METVHVTQLKAGDELTCTMRLGLAIKAAVNQRTKEVYRYVPSTPQKSGPDDWTSFRAFVHANDVQRKVLRVQVTQMGMRGRPNGVGNDMLEISYSSFSKVRLISKIAYPGKPRNPKRPTSYSAFGHMDYRPYHTLTEVILT